MSDAVRIVDNDDAYEQILRAGRTEQLVEDSADRILSTAVTGAPVRSGDYKRGIKKQHKQARYRRVTQVIATDPKSLLIEAKTGNLARAAKAAKR